MADGLNIPGVSDRYKTNDLVNSLMEVERIPLKREEEKVETFKNQQDAWRGINQKMSALRDSAKTLYSFENPFSNKLTSSSEESAVTVEAGREAEFGSFKLEVIQPATTDRFLSTDIDSDYQIKSGQYTFIVGEKKIDFNWKGGKLSDFVNALNRRGGETVKASLIGVSANKKSLLIESLKTGEENRLIFKNQAFELAKEIDMIGESDAQTSYVEITQDKIYTPESVEEFSKRGIPELSKSRVEITQRGVIVSPRGGYEIDLPEAAKNKSTGRLEFTFTEKNVTDIIELTENENQPATANSEENNLREEGSQINDGEIPEETVETSGLESGTKTPDYLELPVPGEIEFEGITILNNQSESTLPPLQENEISMAGNGASVDSTSEENEKEQTNSMSREKTGTDTAAEKIPAGPERIVDDRYFYIKGADRKETLIPGEYVSQNQDGSYTVNIPLNEIRDARALVVRNANTGKELSVGSPVIYTEGVDTGFKPKHAISTAQNATIRYEGITMSRTTNDIDDVVPHLTLHIHDKTERPATIKIDPDTESAKDAVINFVGKYNQTIAEINILSQNKPELITELDYLSTDEQEDAKKRLGMFFGEMSLTTGKSSLQQAVSSTYRFTQDAKITMLNQIGISTNASGASGGGYRPSQMRGYLEIDEKKLDAALAENLSQIKNLFGYDSDGDMIIDNGIAYRLDKQLTSWVQSGGIISSKTNSLESQIKSSNSKITRLQTQLDRKEAELKHKYATMEGTLGNLESQSNSLQNFANQNQRGNR